MTRLLVVDFDYFFPTYETDPKLWQFYDWGHNETFSEGLQEFLWAERAAAFLRAEMPLPHVLDLGKFWDRFTFKTSARLYTAESNVEVLDPRVWKGVVELWLFDAHHDGGYSRRDVLQAYEGRFDCGSWMIYYQCKRVRCWMRYPKWRSNWLAVEPYPIFPMDRKVSDWENDPIPTFDRIFICRSGSWVPPWEDERFAWFVDACPVKKETQITPTPVRVFDLRKAQEMAQRIDQMMTSITHKSPLNKKGDLNDAT